MSIGDRLAARAARGWAASLSPETRRETVAKAREELPRLQGAARKGDKRAGALFAEYAAAFKGRRQLVWSPGLKKRAGIDEVSDEQAAEDAVREAAEEETQVGHFTPKGWARVREHRAAILKMAELAGSAGVDAVVKVITERRSGRGLPP